MTSTPPGGKRATLPRASDCTGEFRKDWDRLTRSGRYDMGRLKAVMMHLIANEGPLPPERRDHALTGDFQDHRECHIGGDFLLIYRLADAGKRPSVVFVRAGTHSELFGR
ncbi:type II toxin-antitoxin system YafQ family toxin [Falsiroseomonas sp.]|jgi:mRNA interferase YafQ|uniref:type II toxin-antitoxin system YafQ family toxin n=1 Tax=Falsiroseomonas sp. TaxID=2870721 RepID=UPI003F702685